MAKTLAVVLFLSLFVATATNMVFANAEQETKDSADLPCMDNCLKICKDAGNPDTYCQPQCDSDCNEVDASPPEQEDEEAVKQDESAVKEDEKKEEKDEKKEEKDEKDADKDEKDEEKDEKDEDKDEKAEEKDEKDAGRKLRKLRK